MAGGLGYCWDAMRRGHWSLRSLVTGYYSKEVLETDADDKMTSKMTRKQDDKLASGELACGKGAWRLCTLHVVHAVKNTVAQWLLFSESYSRAETVPQKPKGKKQSGKRS
jgi:hypothetical protein